MRLIGKRPLVGVVTLLLTATVPALPASAAPHVRSGAIGGDFTVFRPSNGTWYTYFAGIPKLHFGVRGDIPVPGFYNQRSRPNIAVFRPSTGYWYIRGVGRIHYGRRGDVPVPANYDGPDSAGTYSTGKPNIAVFRPSTGYWYIRGVGRIHYGRRGDTAVPADYDGDGYTDIAVFRPSTGTWYVRGIGAFHYGRRGDIPVPGNYVARNSRAQIAVFRPSNGKWYIRGVGTYHYGKRGDIPTPAAFTGHGRTDIAVFRPSTGTWYVRRGEKLHYGAQGDIPVPGAYTGEPIYYPHADERVSGVTTKTGWSTVKLSWAADTYRTGVMIRRAKGSVAPFSPTSGTLVARTRNTAYTDAGLRENTEYSYSLFAIYKHRYASAPTTVTVRTGAPATIAGTVRDAVGSGLASVNVQIFRDRGVSFIAETTTDNRGRYSVGNLPAGSYRVCFDARKASGGSSTTGYLSTCYYNTAWTGSGPPPPATAQVTARSGATVTVNAALQTGGAVAGTVTAASSGTGLTRVLVTVLDRTGHVSGVVTGPDGSYRIDSLSPGAYTLCFDAYGVGNGTLSTGYVSQCNGNVTWNMSANTRRPAQVPPVSVEAGSSHTVDAALADAGAISGTLRTADGTPLYYAHVDLFDAQGQFVGTQFVPDPSGVYSLQALSPGKYTVCFDASGAGVLGQPLGSGYASKCYQQVAWDGNVSEPAPSGTTSVTVSANQTTTAVDASLPAQG